MSDQVRQINDEMVEVNGPAIVRTSNSEYEITTDLKLKFPVDTEVWVKVWPRDDS